MPPFEPNSQQNLNGDVRFKMVKKWLKHSRGFVRMSDKGPTVFWDELMKIRLQTWQLEMGRCFAIAACRGTPDGDRGLVGKQRASARREMALNGWARKQSELGIILIERYIIIKS